MHEPLAQTGFPKTFREEQTLQGQIRIWVKSKQTNKQKKKLKKNSNQTKQSTFKSYEKLQWHQSLEMSFTSGFNLERFPGNACLEFCYKMCHQGVFLCSLPKMGGRTLWGNVKKWRNETGTFEVSWQFSHGWRFPPTHQKWTNQYEPFFSCR